MTNEVQVRKGTRGVTAVTAEELEAKLSGPVADVPEDVREEVETWIEDYKAFLVERVTANVQRGRMQGRDGPEAGGPISPINTELWDIFPISPIQVLAPPFGYPPGQIIRSGELCLFLAVLLINPNPDFGGFSGTQLVSGHGFRVRAETIDLTNMVTGPAFDFVGVFPAFPPAISIFPIFSVPVNPGPIPQVRELNWTVDITDPAQPIAAFGTQFFKVDDDPGFPVPVPPGFRFGLPNRFLVYPFV